MNDVHDINKHELRKHQLDEIKKVMMLNKKQIGAFTESNYCIGWIAGILEYGKH